MQDETDGLDGERRAMSCYSLADLCREDWGGKAKIFLIKLAVNENVSCASRSTNFSQRTAYFKSYIAV